MKYQVGRKALHQPLEQFGLRLTPHGKKRSSSFSSIVLTFPASGSIRSGLWWSAFFWTIISSLIDARTFRVRCWLNHWPPFPPEQNSACSYYTILTGSSNPVLNGFNKYLCDALDCNSQVGWVGLAYSYWVERKKTATKVWYKRATRYSLTMTFLPSESHTCIDLQRSSVFAWRCILNLLYLLWNEFTITAVALKNKGRIWFLVKLISCWIHRITWDMCMGKICEGKASHPNIMTRPRLRRVSWL